MAILNLLTIIALWGLKAFVMFKSWYWFIIPLFPGAPAMGYLQMLGILFFVTTVTFKGDFNNLELDEAETLTRNLIRCVALLFALLCSFLLSLAL